ncbi:MAG TPA: dihydrofolate reductase family protein, partial [Puia sp.]|nr:dihydrofolate reductase family protein [Puia sp.]
DWHNSTMCRGDIKTKVQELKNLDGKDIMIYGSGSLVSTLLPVGLLDEYQLWVHPVILGQGRPFFVGLTQKVELRLAETKRFDSGVVILKYEAS